MHDFKQYNNIAINSIFVQLSIIIPAHNRPDVLATCLEHLEKQTIADQLEVLVVADDNGNTTSHCAKKNYQCNVRFIEIHPTHQGVARNRGVEQAAGDIVLFIGDDIFLNPKACETHLETYERLMKNKEWAESNELSATGYPLSAILGFTTWDPVLTITPVMRWLEQSGWQFGYPHLARYASQFVKKSVQHQYCYTSHISLPIGLAKAHPFREDVLLYGWEDIEWGLRLSQSNISLFYEPSAIAWHHHYITLQDSLQRMKILGRSVVHLSRLVPELDRLPTGFKRLAYECAALLPTMAGQHRKAFLKGVKQANKG